MKIYDKADPLSMYLEAELKMKNEKITHNYCYSYTSQPVTDMPQGSCCRRLHEYITLYASKDIPQSQ